MKTKRMLKTVIDAMMTIALLLLMAYERIGQAAHEWIGVGMFVLFVIHHVLNAGWSKNVLNGRYTAQRVLQTVIVALVFISMLGSMVSGIMLSRHAFAFLSLTGGRAFARTLHMLSGYWGFVFMSLHLGLHWGVVTNMARKLVGNPSEVRKWVLRTIAIFIAGYGTYAFFKRGIGSYMLLVTRFAFFDFEEPLLLFWLDYIAVMGLFIAIGYHMPKALKDRKRQDGFKEEK